MDEAELYQIGEMFKKYFEGKDSSGNIELKLKDIVFTGEEIMRMSEYFYTKVEERNLSPNIISKIEKIIKRKKGTIIDEIREVLKEKSD